MMRKAYIYSGETVALKFLAKKSGETLDLIDFDFEIKICTTSMGNTIVKSSKHDTLDLMQASDGIVVCRLSSADTAGLTPGHGIIGITIRRDSQVLMGAASPIDVLRPMSIPTPRNSRTIPLDLVVTDKTIDITMDFTLAGRDGRDGVDGLTPYIGDNGHWWIGKEDTGVDAAPDVAPRVRDSAPFAIDFSHDFATVFLEEDGSIYSNVPADFSDGRHWPTLIRVIATIKALSKHTQTDIDFPPDCNVSWIIPLNAIQENFALYEGNMASASIRINDDIIGTIDLESNVALSYDVDRDAVTAEFADVLVISQNPITDPEPTPTTNAVVTLSFSNSVSDQYVFNQSDEEILAAIEGYVAGSHDLLIVFQPSPDSNIAANTTVLPFVAGMMPTGTGGNDVAQFVLTACYFGKDRYFPDRRIYMNLAVPYFATGERRLYKTAGVTASNFRPSTLSTWPNWYGRRQLYLSGLNAALDDGLLYRDSQLIRVNGASIDIIEIAPVADWASDYTLTITTRPIPDAAKLATKKELAGKADIYTYTDEDTGETTNIDIEQLFLSMKYATGALNEAIKKKANTEDLSNIYGEPTSADSDAEFEARTGFTREDMKKDLFIDMWNAACRSYGKYNEQTGYFELNGLTDITYEEALYIYASTIGVWADTGYAKMNFRTNIYLRNASPLWGTGQSEGIAPKSMFRSCPLLEVARVADDLGVWWASHMADFDYCPKLREVKGVVGMYYPDERGDMQFRQCYALENINIRRLIKNVNFIDSPKLSLQSLNFLIHNRDGYTKAITVTVHPDVYAKLTGDTTNAAAAALTPEEAAQWKQLVTDAAANNIQFATV